MVEAPTGDLSGSRRTPTSTRLRRSEEITLKQGRTSYNSAALDADGTVVAYSNLATMVHGAEDAFQWGTLVRRDDRGHRLGLAVKVAALRLLHAGRGACPADAHVERRGEPAHDRHQREMGFRPVERMGEFQKILV